MVANNVPAEKSELERRHRKVAGASFALVCVMVGLSFAAVPLYRVFCQVTGYGGTTKRVEANTGPVLDQRITVRFDSNTSGGLPWDFRPAEHTVELKIGENKLAFYRATNTSDKTVRGTATFNVTPEIAGSYFNKVSCFCFTEQTLKAGETVDMPVSFFIDPAIVDDADARGISEITLSYTFFPIKKTAAVPARAAVKRDGG